MIYTVHVYIYRHMYVYMCAVLLLLHSWFFKQLWGSRSAYMLLHKPRVSLLAFGLFELGGRLHSDLLSERCHRAEWQPQQQCGRGTLLPVLHFPPAQRSRLCFCQHRTQMEPPVVVWVLGATLCSKDGISTSSQLSGSLFCRSEDAAQRFGASPPVSILHCVPWPPWPPSLPNLPEWERLPPNHSTCVELRSLLAARSPHRGSPWQMEYFFTSCWVGPCAEK